MLVTCPTWPWACTAAPTSTGPCTLHQAAGVDEMPLAATMGAARVIEITHPRQVTADELRGHSLRR